MTFHPFRSAATVTVVPLAAVAVCGLFLTPSHAPATTPLEAIQKEPRPKFRPGHTLPPLTRWGWSMPFDVRIELCEHWGYALEFGTINPRAVQRLDDPASDQARLVALTKSDPDKYPLCVTTLRPFHDRQFLVKLPQAAWCHDENGNLIEPKPGRGILCPEAPDSIYHDAGRITAEPIAALRKRVPIAVLHNGGEYGMSVFGFHGSYWARDPRCVQAKGVKSWFQYLSERKAHGELIIADAVRKAANGGLYLYYPTSGCPHRNRSLDWWKWAYGYEWMKPVSDIPNGESYYNHFNTGWTGHIDMLTLALNSVGLQIALGEPLSYNWVCAGWTRDDLGEKAFGDMRHYMGFLKCYYTAGMIGGVAGDFAYPQGGVKADLGDKMPSWLQQMLVLGRVHALFSHLEDDIRNGDLLPGPCMHRWSSDRPAYEIPTGETDARVLARKHRERNSWLVTAWAAGGEDRDVKVTILGLGELELRARDCGTVYRVTAKDGGVRLDLLDPDGMRPSTAF
ncbi:MAG TPA: hypothetical protein EYP56_13255 [Planctomycetaceae bacterium]|nr:hypothetical protein [Planctomycetaceae bacterium]